MVPRGAWFKCPNGDVIENPCFEGLCDADAQHHKSYLHARPPREKWNTNLLSRPDYDYALDFLDSVDMDVPQGKDQPCFNRQRRKEKRRPNDTRDRERERGGVRENTNSFLLPSHIYTRMLEFAISVGRSLGHFAQYVLARNDVLPQVKFSALRIFIRRPREEELRFTFHALM